MTTSEALWEVFKATGHIGAYLLYKEFSAREAPNGLGAESFKTLENVGWNEG